MILTNKDPDYVYVKNLAATAHNLLLVIRDKQWERLESKVWDFENAIELLENRVLDNSLPKEEPPVSPEGIEEPQKSEDMKTGIKLIAEERLRQVEVEGYTSTHDKEHVYGEIAKAAACYAVHHTDARVFDPGTANDDLTISIESAWPWDDKQWKPSKDKIKNLVKAGALIAAEIDRLKNK